MNVRLISACSFRRAIQNRPALLVLALLCIAVGTLRAQDSVNDNPTGPTGDYNGEVTTGGSYDPFTGNAKRAVTDLVVPGSNGTYPLAFARTSNSIPSGPPHRDTRPFGDGGNWRHSYMWTIEPFHAQPGDNQTIGSTGGYNVYYPSGSVVSFRPGRTTAPTSEIYWRGPTGTQDRLEVASGNGLVGAVLHLSDGGFVIFGGNSHAALISDPYGAATALQYNLSGNPNYLTDVIEPGGRYLHLDYDTVQSNTGGPTHIWVVLKAVTANGTRSTPLGGNVQRVTYSYSENGNRTHDNGSTVTYDSSPYYVLSGVSYDTEGSIAGGQVQATYTYDQDNGSCPVLWTAKDPHYAGAMTSIHYEYLDPAYGFISQEQNIDGSTVVSTLQWDRTNYAAQFATETRGDSGPNSTPTKRTFHYGETSHFGGPNGGSTQAKAAQLTSYTDFQGHTTNLYYYGTSERNGAGDGNLFAVVDALGRSTSYYHEPITGKVNSTQLPDGRVRQQLYWSKNAGDSNGWLQPYYLLQSTDERNQQTNYVRYPNTGLVHFINYPDTSSEEFQYTRLYSR